MRSILAAAALAGTAAFADPAVIEDAEAWQTGAQWRFSVILSHDDTGWEDYADGWRVVTADGAILGTRELLHPHVIEQPFTRALSGVTVPDGINQVFIEARTSRGDWDATPFLLELR